MRAATRSAADRVLAGRRAARAASVLGAARGRGLALLWHRIRPDGPSEHEAVPAVASADLARQLDVLHQLGDVVPLSEVERPRRSRRPRFALTFDDDDPGHAEHTLPLLRERGLPATFFLSGRWRDHHGPYWWEVLEARLRREGVDAVATGYGLPASLGAPRLAAALTGTPGAAELATSTRGLDLPTMTLGQARDLVSAGMEIGFHTLHHPSLVALRDDAERQAAVQSGRDELATELGTPIVRFAYPHGHVDGRVAATARAAGYRSAWTTAKRVTTRGEDPMRLGRWDLGHLRIDDFRNAILRGLLRPSP